MKAIPLPSHNRAADLWLVQPKPVHDAESTTGATEDPNIINLFL